MYNIAKFATHNGNRQLQKVFREIASYKIQENPFHLIGKQWMLITAGNKSEFNTMTASWGGFGILWNVPVSYIFVRPTRHTYQFTEANPYYTLCFFENKYKSILTYCGTHSGKTVDKITECGLVPLETEKGNIYFEQSKLVIECSKMYYDDIRPGNFIDNAIEKNYPIRDYHRMYIGKIVNCLAKD